MSASEFIGAILGIAGGGAIGFLLIASAALYFFLPLMAFSVARNIKGIRLALERLADTPSNQLPVKQNQTLGI